MKLFGVRQAAVIEPEFLVEASEIHDKSIALPTAHGAAVVDRVVGVAIDLSDLLPSVQVHDSSIPIAAALKDPDALKRRIFDKLKSVLLLVVARSTGRFAEEEHRIVF